MYVYTYMSIIYVCICIYFFLNSLRVTCRLDVSLPLNILESSCYKQCLALCILTKEK